MRSDRSRTLASSQRDHPISLAEAASLNPTGEIPGAFDCLDFVVHNQARVVARDPLTVVTDRQQWSYSVAFRLRPGSRGTPQWRGPCLVRVAATVESGAIGMIFVTDDLRTTAGTQAAGSASASEALFEVKIGSMPDSGWLVIRNNAEGEKASRCRIRTITMFRSEAVNLPFPVSVRHRSLESEPVPDGGGIETFDAPDALKLNRARMVHLASLDLPLRGKSVLDVGCGVGHLAQFFLDQDCRVVGVDGRPENIEGLRARYPDREAHVGSCESDLSRFGQFDVVLAYGLLYHTENPVAVLRNMAAVCKELLLLETIVCDSDAPVVVFDDETKTVSQALHGLGSRPSPSFVVTALDRVGIPFVYAAKVQPDHPDFRFRWRNTLDWRRDGHLLRCVFVGARYELNNDRLVLMNPRG